MQVRASKEHMIALSDDKLAMSQNATHNPKRSPALASRLAPKAPNSVSGFFEETKTPNIRNGGWSALSESKAPGQANHASKSSPGLDAPRSNGNGVRLKERNMKSKIFTTKTQKVVYDARFTNLYNIIVELSSLNSFKKIETPTFSPNFT